MAREPIPTWYFALVVVRCDDRFLVVREREHGQLWYLPAGRVEPSEGLVAAAERETLEEAGIRVVVDGVVRLEHLPLQDGTARMRVVFVAHPAEGAVLTEAGGRDALGAAWVTLEELEGLQLRDPEVRDLFCYLKSGGLTYPPDVLSHEGAPYVTQGQHVHDVLAPPPDSC